MKTISPNYNSFRTWVIWKHKGMDDPCGDFAAEIERDSDFPNIDDKDVILIHLEKFRVCDEAMEVFNELYNSYNLLKFDFLN